MSSPGLPLNLKEVRNRAEREAVARAISASAGNISRAAELLGVSRPTLYDLMSRHDLAATAVARQSFPIRPAVRMRQALAAECWSCRCGRCARDVDPVTGVAQATRPGASRASLVRRASAQEPVVEACQVAHRPRAAGTDRTGRGQPQAASDELSTLDEAALRDPEALQLLGTR